MSSEFAHERRLTSTSRPLSALAPDCPSAVRSNWMVLQITSQMTMLLQLLDLGSKRLPFSQIQALRSYRLFLVQHRNRAWVSWRWSSSPCPTWNQIFLHALRLFSPFPPFFTLTSPWAWWRLNADLLNLFLTVWWKWNGDVNFVRVTVSHLRWYSSCFLPAFFPACLQGWSSSVPWWGPRRPVSYWLCRIDVDSFLSTERQRPTREPQKRAKSGWGTISSSWKDLKGDNPPGKSSPGCAWNPHAFQLHPCRLPPSLTGIHPIVHPPFVFVF